MSPPTKRQILDLLDAIEVALQAFVSRWDDDLAPEAREEILRVAYEPIMHLLVACKRR